MLSIPNPILFGATPAINNDHACSPLYKIVQTVLVKARFPYGRNSRQDRVNIYLSTARL